MFELGALSTLILLVVGHFIADYPLQGEFLAKAKNRKRPVKGVPWYQALIAHSMIHGGAVYIITGNPFLFLLEVFLHFLIDDAKCQSKLDFNTDQALHIGCKLLYFAILLPFGLPN